MIAKPDFTPEELRLIIEGLESRAARHESMARFYPRNARVHEKTAGKMRKLRDQLSAADAISR
jgi:hypothetical protein